MIYNAIIADPAPVVLAMRSSLGGPFTGEGPCYLDLSAVPGLAREDYDISSTSIDGSLQGQATTVTVEMLMPGASYLVGATGKYLLLWADYPAPAGMGRVFSFGKIDPLPSSIGNTAGKVTIEFICRRDDWQRAVHNAAKAVVPVLSEFYDPDTGPSTADLLAATTLVPVIDRRSMQVSMRPSYAAVDVMDRPPGNFVSNGIKVYDITDYALANGFDLQRVSSVTPIKQLATKFSVAWNQYAAGPCDLGPIVQLGVFGNDPGTSGQIFGFSTLTPDEFKSSFPKAGASLGTGWTVIRANLVSRDYQVAFMRSPYEARVVSMLAQGYGVTSTSDATLAGDYDGTGTVNLKAADMGLAAGANVGCVAWYEYTQPRRESVMMVCRIGLDDLVTGNLPDMTGAKVNLGDPTSIDTGTPWLPETFYDEDDVAWFGGRRQTALVQHISGDDFDPTKWAAEDPPADAVATNGTAYAWNPSTFYPAGSCVHPSMTDNTFWYRNKAGISVSTTWLQDKANWTQGPSPVQAMSTMSPVYMATDRGKASLRHLDQRSTAQLFRAARCWEAVTRLRFDDVLDASIDLRAVDIVEGMVLRIRTASLTSGISEVIGVVTKFRMSVQPNGRGAIEVRLGLIPGKGLNAPGTDATLGATEMTYKFSDARIPIDVYNLWNWGYSVLGTARTGATFGAQKAAVQNAINNNDGTNPNSFTESASSAISDGGLANRAQIIMRPLVQEGLIPLSHPTMLIKTKPAPRNIGFSG